MKKSRTFWAAAALVSLAALAFASYSIYERVSLHFSGDTIEVHPVPMPPPQPLAEETAPEAAKPAPEKAAPEAKKPQPAEQEKPKAVKTAFEYKDAKAKSVSIAGSFTSWKDIRMTKKNGVWKTDIYILPGTYPYHFTVDGKKKLDPGKPKAPMGDSLIKVD
jgi:hypothetical protein